VQGICAQETFPGFDRIWTNCINEETFLVSMEDTYSFCVLTMVIFLHSIYNGEEGKEENMHQQ
jgi:hypothetical protein